MRDVVVRKGGHGEVAVVVAVLPPHLHVAFVLGCCDKVLGEQLALVVEVVVCALFFKETSVVENDSGRWMDR